jgi:hypothetical protein
MKKILFILSVSVAFLLISKESHAQETGGQNYQTAIGLKFGGYENGISIKYFANPSVAFEGVLGFRDHGVVITGLYEFNQEAFGVPELKFYYGAGAHIGSESSGVYKTFDGINETYNGSHILLGVDGVVGLEYIIPQSPIGISIDLNPRAELASGPFFDLAPGLGLKYTF